MYTKIFYNKASQKKAIIFHGNHSQIFFTTTEEEYWDIIIIFFKPKTDRNDETNGVIQKGSARISVRVTE